MSHEDTAEIAEFEITGEQNSHMTTIKPIKHYKVCSAAFQHHRPYRFIILLIP